MLRFDRPCPSGRPAVPAGKSSGCGGKRAAARARGGGGGHRVGNRPAVVVGQVASTAGGGGGEGRVPAGAECRHREHSFACLLARCLAKAAVWCSSSCGHHKRRTARSARPSHRSEVVARCAWVCMLENPGQSTKGRSACHLLSMLSMRPHNFYVSPSDRVGLGPHGHYSRRRTASRLSCAVE